MSTELILVKNLNTGDAFKHNELDYVAISLVDKENQIFCLNIITKEIEILDFDAPVHKLGDWFVIPYYQEPLPQIKNPLKVLI